MAGKFATAAFVCSLPCVYGQFVILANGVEMPTVGLGTWRFNETEASAAVQAALKAGYKHLDCAHNYNNQVGIGQGLAASGKKRDEVFITSKVPGCGVQGLAKDDCYGNSMKFVHEDITQLSKGGFPTKYVDLLLIHFPPCMEGKDPFYPNPIFTPCEIKKNGCSNPDNCRAIAEQWRAMEDAYRAGLARAIGVSDFCSACFKCLGANATVMPMLNNLQYHIGMEPDPQGVRAFAKTQGMVLMAWSPLAHGGGWGKEVPIYERPLPVKIGKKHGKSGAQVALKWILSHNVSLSVKTGNPKHLAENIDVFDWELTPDEMAALDADTFEKDTNPSFMCINDSPEIVV